MEEVETENGALQAENSQLEISEVTNVEKTLHPENSQLEISEVTTVEKILQPDYDDDALMCHWTSKS